MTNEIDTNKIYYVYAWYYKDTGKVFYVGKGKNNRYIETGNRNQYFKNIISKNEVCVKKLFENLSESEAFDLEIKTIKQYKQLGECKANFHEGGRGGNTGNYNNPERSRRLSEFAKTRVGDKNPNWGHRWTLEQRKHLSELNKGKSFMSEETRKRMSEIRIGRKLSEETKKKLSNSLRGRKQPYSEIMNNWIAQLRYKYTVYQNNEVVYIGFSKKFLYKYCKNDLNITKNIVNELIEGTYQPTFAKHMFIKNISIVRSQITKEDKDMLKSKCVSINPDECKDVDWRLVPIEVRGSLDKNKEVI